MSMWKQKNYTYLIVKENLSLLHVILCKFWYIILILISKLLLHTKLWITQMRFLGGKIVALGGKFEHFDLKDRNSWTNLFRLSLQLEKSIPFKKN